MNKVLFIKFLLSLCLILLLFPSIAQKASVSEGIESIKTYPYSDPNPVPVLGINKKVAPFYPYFMFDGYTDKSVNKQWKVVKLENDYVTVYVLPDVGGKVMGAIEKATGNEFVYLNHVMKFRAIGIRGPWTSGGIEHNFGLDLGHAPWAAAAVDYVIKNNEDGSVSCIVGGTDLASRSEWRVNIRLPKDKAYFETEALWYNPTPLHHAYLSWENAAFKASNDLQFYFPGNYHIGHDGLASPWPIDKEGHNLSIYKENNFGGSKSYHVVGNYRNWFGGYWHNKNFGFCHWSPYTDAPGKKLWIWSLPREGSIWVNLLTDTDGHYIEAQSGVKLNQAAERSGFHSPFSQLSLRPLYTETKREYWFPVKNTGGMSDATPYGTLNVITLADSLEISISPNAAINDSLVVSYNNHPVYTAYLQLQPLQIFKKKIAVPSTLGIRVRVGNDKLLYSSNKKENEVDRPYLTSASDRTFRSAQRFFRMAEDENAMRNYKLALSYYMQCLATEPTHNDALCRVAEFYYRSGLYDSGIVYARKVLEYNSYDGGANYIYGNLLLRLKRLPEAQEAFSIAARTMEYRSAAYTSLAGIAMQKEDFVLVAEFAKQALTYNSNNLLAHQLLATAYRKLKDTRHADSTLKVLLEIDPLNHYAHFEQYLLHPSAATFNAFKVQIKNELPHETYLELAITYANNGLVDEAIKVLEQAPSYPTVFYWLAYLTKNTSPAESLAYIQKAEKLSPKFVFPFRLETIPVLTWALTRSASWKTSYYLALDYWNNLRTNNAKELFEKCGDTPDFAPFYLARGALFKGDSAKTDYVGKDYERAVQLEPGEWRTWHYQCNHLLEINHLEQFLAISKKAYSRFITNPVIAMDYAKALLTNNKLEDCLQVLQKVLILPQEGAQEGHEIYELANLSLALLMMEQNKYRQAIHHLNNSRKWPENLGSGSPYNPDQRLQDFMAARCEEKLRDQKKAEDYYFRIKTYSLNREIWSSSRNQANNYISVLVLKTQEKQQELNKLMASWKAEQDSLSNWNIAQGSSAPELQWVLAKNSNDVEMPKKLEKELLAGGTKNRFYILFKTLQLTDKKKL